MQLNHRITVVKNKHCDCHSPVLCTVKRLRGIGEKFAVNVIGAPPLAFFNTFNLGYINVDSSQIKSFINVSVASCPNKTQEQIQFPF